jgi:hypothetical protein
MSVSDIIPDSVNVFLICPYAGFVHLIVTSIP